MSLGRGPMRRRFKAGGKPSTSRRRKVPAAKPRNATKAVGGHHRPGGGEETELAQLAREREEALEQLSAASKVLNVINASPGDLQAVFAAILVNATRICQAKFGTLYRFDGEKLHFAAEVGAPRDLAEFYKQRGPYVPPSGSHIERVVRTKRPSQTADYTADTFRGPAARFARAGSTVWVPMLMDDVLVGVILVYRQEVDLFTDRQIALLQSFAAQAVTAIENARLLNELRKSLEQQTATADVLRVISSSPGELEPVFRAMLENATRICEAKFGVMQLHENGAFRTSAIHNAPAAYVEAIAKRGPLFHPGPIHPFARVATSKQSLHISDYREDAAYKQRDPGAVRLVELAGARTVLTVPMLKDNALIGLIIIYRTEVRPFADKQVALVENFAAQAVIAIENTRLLNELRESLERQTATSQVLSVISSSPGNLQPVFQTILQNAVKICAAKFGTLFMCEGDAFRAVVLHNAPSALVELRRREPLIRPSPENSLARAFKTKTVIQIPDVTAEEAYLKRDPARMAIVELAGYRSLLTVPMLKQNEIVGAFNIYRQEPEAFTDKQIELLENFAAQAVIAIENSRLLDDLSKLNQHLEQRVNDQVGEIERMSRLRRFLPPQVADLIVASGTEKQLESHRREITALFCDLRGFTGFSESSDPEDVMALLRDYHAAIGEIIIKYSGTLERYAGDGVMVIFNDPVPVERPAKQAVLMALEMRGTISALVNKWKRLGHDLGFGIGIAHGFATLGTVGFEGRFDYAAIGTVSNVASRLCDEAKSGQILISPRVLMAVEDSVTVESVGEFELKGIRRPMLAYNVLASAPHENLN